MENPSKKKNHEVVWDTYRSLFQFYFQFLENTVSDKTDSFNSMSLDVGKGHSVLVHFFFFY